MSEDVAWAAGLFEGEGSIVFTRGRYVQLRLSMSDEDVIDRFHAVFACGNKNGPNSYRPTEKPMFRWVTHKSDDVQQVLTAMLPFLGERRTHKALEALEAIACIKPSAHRKKMNLLSPQTQNNI